MSQFRLQTAHFWLRSFCSYLQLSISNFRLLTSHFWFLASYFILLTSYFQENKSKQCNVNCELLKHYVWNHHGDFVGYAQYYHILLMNVFNLKKKTNSYLSCKNFSASDFCNIALFPQNLVFQVMKFIINVYLHALFAK